MADNNIDKAKSILAELPEDERTFFIDNFKKLESDEKRGIAVDRLISNYNEVKQPEQKQTVEESMSGMFGESKAGQMGERVAVDAIIAPLTEVVRGLYSGSAGFYDKAKATAQLADQVIGTIKEKVPQGARTVMPMMQEMELAQPVIKKAGEVFSNWAEALQETSEDIPETQMGVVPKTIYQLGGAAIPITTEFAVLQKGREALGVSNFLKSKGLQSLGEVSDFAVYGALTEFAKDPNNRALLEGAMEGAKTGMIFPVALKSMELLKNFGKRQAQNFVHLVTGSSKTAREFIKNYRKYNLNPFGKTKTVEEVQADNMAAKLRLDNANKEKVNIFKSRQRQERELLEIKLKDRLFETRKQLDDLKLSLNEKSRVKLEDATRAVEQNIKKNQQYVSESLVKTYDDALTELQLLYDNYGKQVKRAINITLEQNPGAGIKTKYVKDKVDDVLKDSPFKISKKKVGSDAFGKGGRNVTMQDLPEHMQSQLKAQGLGAKEVSSVQSDTGAFISEATTFERILNLFDDNAKTGELGVGYLQRLKDDTKALSQQAYKQGKSKLGEFYANFSSTVDPAKIVSDNPVLNNSLKEIAKANKEYSTYLPKYKEAIKRFFTKDAEGRFIPDINKAVAAVRGQKSDVVRQLRKADMALPVDKRLLPKIHKTVSEQSKFVDKQKASIKLLKKKAQQEQIRLMKSSKQTINNLKKEQAGKRFTDKEKSIAELNNFVNKKNAEYESVIDDLNKVEEFYINQERLRGFKASGTTPAGMLQRAGLYGSVLSGSAAAFRPELAAKTGVLSALTLGLTPIISAGAVKAAANTATPTYRLLRNLLSSKAVRQTVGGKIIQKKKDNK